MYFGFFVLLIGLFCFISFMLGSFLASEKAPPYISLFFMLGVPVLLIYYYNCKSDEYDKTATTKYAFYPIRVDEETNAVYYVKNGYVYDADELARGNIDERYHVVESWTENPESFFISDRISKKVELIGEKDVSR